MPDPATCELNACIDTCRAVEAAREGDSDRRFDTHLRTTRCSARGCPISFEFDGDCYVKTNEFDVTSRGPFDRASSDDALFERTR